MGFLKGRWSSLRGLRLRMDDEKGVQYASLWITSCIALHAFAMDHEHDIPLSTNNFYKQGRKLMRDERRERESWQTEREELLAREEADGDDGRDIELLEGRLKRENLKKELFSYMESNEMDVDE